MDAHAGAAVGGLDHRPSLRQRKQRAVLHTFLVHRGGVGDHQKAQALGDLFPPQNVRSHVQVLGAAVGTASDKHHVHLLIRTVPRQIHIVHIMGFGYHGLQGRSVNVDHPLIICFLVPPDLPVVLLPAELL